MRGARCALLLAGLVAAAGLIPQEAGAIPVFSRKYGVNCTMCHSSYPRLNDFGARFRANGYRMPGLTSSEKTVLESPAPVALRSSAGFDHVEEPFVQDVNALELKGLDILSAGLLGQRVGFFVVFVPGISGAKGVAAQDASLEMANVVFSGLAKGRLAIRAGRFEPAYTAFSVKRQLSVAPYEVYGYSFSGGPTYAETQTGVEVRYGGYGPVRAVAGYVAGSENNLPKDAPQDAYFRLEGVLGPGEGQTAGQRIGVAAYSGRSRPSFGFSDLKDFTRVAADASLNWRTLNLGVQYLWAFDKAALWRQSGNVEWSGGFAEMTYLTPVGLTGFTRVDVLNRPAFALGDVWRFTVGGRYYFVENLAAHLEYSHRGDMDGGGALEDFVTARLDLAF